jgi:VanZ family protein
MMFDLAHSARLFLLICGALTLTVIAVATLVPQRYRPRSRLPVDVERALAFALATSCLALGLPDHQIAVLCLMIAGAGALEWMQTLQPGRHGVLRDFYVKASGAILGAAIGWISNLLTGSFEA